MDIVRFYAFTVASACLNRRTMQLGEVVLCLRTLVVYGCREGHFSVVHGRENWHPLVDAHLVRAKTLHGPRHAI
jgi:hypothetical protein